MEHCGDSGGSSPAIVTSSLLSSGFDDSAAMNASSTSLEADVSVTSSAVPASFAKVTLTVDDLIADVVGSLQLLKCSLCEELLTDPVQLNCLHNCCRQCVQRSGTSECLTCKMCQEVCDTACSTTNNIFIESLVQQHRAALEPPICNFCKEEEGVEEQANVWCSQCEKYLCFNCLSGHKRFNKTHMPVPFDSQQAVPESSSAAAAALRLCRLHKKPFEHMCVHCKLPKCFDCALECSGSEHEMHFLKSPKTETFLSEVRLEVRKLKELLQSKIDILYLCQKMHGNLLAARSADMSKLKENKKAVLRAVESAYQTAEDNLQICYDNLAPKAHELASFAECLLAKAVHAVSYCEHLDSSGDVVSFIQQETALRLRLQSLAAEMRDVRKPVGASDCVNLNAAGVLPSDMESVACEWIGHPKVATNDLVAMCASAVTVNPVPRCDFDGVDSIRVSKKCAGTQTLDMQPLETNVEFTRSLATNCLPPGNDGDLGVMRVADHFRSSEETDRCYDLAVTLRNTVVVAQGEEGLIEYDFVEHCDLSNWSPSSPDSVTTVDVVDDCRIVVGLREAQAIVVLQYWAYCKVWLEFKRLQLHAAPFTLSVYGDIVAVSEWMLPQVGKNSSKPGPTLNLLSLSSQSAFWRKPLHFNIFSVAAMESTVAIASWIKGGSDRDLSSHLVASYGHNGCRRWQREFTDRVYGICASPSTPVLYLAIRNANRVMAIAEKSGRNLINVCFDDNAITSPWRLSVSKGNGPAVLTVIESDFKTITVYPIVAHTMLPASG